MIVFIVCDLRRDAVREGRAYKHHAFLPLNVLAVGALVHDYHIFVPPLERYQRKTSLLNFFSCYKSGKYLGNKFMSIETSAITYFPGSDGLLGVR